MTDISADRFDWSNAASDARLKKRKKKQLWLQVMGIGSITVAFLMLFILVASLLSTGASAFRQTHVTLDVYLDPELISPENAARGNYRTIIQNTLTARFPDVTEPRDIRALGDILSNGAQFTIRDTVEDSPELIGQTISLKVPVSDPYDLLEKGLIDRDTPEANRRLNDAQIAWFDQLKADGAVSRPFNTALFVNADSRFPELAGLKGALIGSFYALMVCFLLSFPVGIGAAIYLEEFAPKNRFSDLVEININNLAAVPSVVFGLLALAVFLNWFGLPRSAPFVGGLTLALMTLPTIIIATRAALKAVPPSIREAALGVGASKQQVVFGHVLPLAMPGILTGTIIGLAQALGETAPLLLIGMNSFITSAPATPFDSATALPTQIFIWADSPERGFVSRTSAAILVLLGFLVVMNALAIFLRNRFERRW
ncbi:phosphate ABC transporter permease PstA [Halovulum dunhuangense]|uniref:Phosphate transport system permease protein PstA n=1 Tax=Halovulum dunhuangense TaxID=1505036 RepID=A0A849L0F4_9RHOB|nr:phosphate ABC transporter permease PstA [Halovulum dunhuangense]NNU79746.1 phosphate ABC transporter permease PstA [Halovulum dunhuangense]